jgi:1-acyl-sn-glycerol-3-phosphate acyltransferase
MKSGNRLFSYVSRYLVRLIFFCSCRVKRSWAAVPGPGAYILVANHISHFDPPMIGCWFPRYVDWMAMDELYRVGWSAWLMDALSAFPVKRSNSDAGAMRTALHRLRLGRVVGIFPEGGIRAGESSVLEGAAMWPGFAAVSLLSGKPIVPCVILGSDRLYRTPNWLPFRRVSVWLISGQPIWPSMDLPRSRSREMLIQQVSAAFLQLRQRAIERFQLRAEDLPKTPQARKRENHFPPSVSRRSEERK